MMGLPCSSSSSSFSDLQGERDFYERGFSKFGLVLDFLNWTQVIPDILKIIKL